MKVFLLILSLAAAAKPGPTWDQAVRASLSEKLPQGVRVELDGLRVSIPVQSRVQVQNFSPAFPLGWVSFEVQTQDAQGRVTRGQGSATVRAFGKVAVTTAPVQSGETLGDGNLAFQERELSRLVQSGYFLGAEALGNRVARGYLAPGQVIGRGNSQPPALVSAGESVQLVRRKRGLQISAKVRALQSGFLHQKIHVQNPSSGKFLLARVSGPGEVELP